MYLDTKKKRKLSREGKVPTRPVGGGRVGMLLSHRGQREGPVCKAL